MVKDKEIENKNQLIEILEKDHKKLKHSMENINNNNGDVKNLMRDKLKKKNLEILKIN